MNNSYFSLESVNNKSLVLKDEVDFLLSASSSPELSSYRYLDLIDDGIIVHCLFLYYQRLKQKDGSFMELFEFFDKLDKNELILSSVDTYFTESRTFDELYEPIGFDSLSGDDLFFWYYKYLKEPEYVRNSLSGTYFKQFTESVGTFLYFNSVVDSLLSYSNTSELSSITDYPLMIENKLDLDVVDFLNEGNSISSKLQRDNYINISTDSSPYEAHGSSLVKDSGYIDKIDLNAFQDTLKSHYKLSYRLLNIFNEYKELSSYGDFRFDLDGVLVDRLQNKIKLLLNQQE